VTEEDCDGHQQGFVLGVIVGAAVAWLWGREVEEYVEKTTRGVRTKAAEGVQVVEEKVSEALRAGQEAIRPAPVTRGA
jgi:hypothetical protein